ncbi:ABC transporter permease [Actinomarinicola tropica]|uniref:Transport permease protein n=1 Tax=Actinomarinicola tropica TaxID=2789776 RepID=A0A5Q2RK33_9ACTN|nr:ABC transporter permease [Actinomarinicola tropica]QGG95844.1 ABC transporter permease [Actinomarinicola tropica]
MSIVGERVSQAYPTELLSNLTLRELRSKYKRSVLGWTWSIANPLMTIAVYTVVFATFIDIPPPVGDPSGMHIYGFFLVCGLLPWTLLAQGLTGAVSSLTANEGLIKKVYFPRSVLTTATVLSWLASHLIEVGVLLVALLLFGNMVLPWAVPLLLVTLLLSGFILGLGLLLAPANVYFRDIEHFTGIFLNLWFWLTPIIYPASLLEHRQVGGIELTTLLELNPMFHFVEAYRSLLYDLAWPSLTTWLAMVAAAGMAVVVGALAFRRLEPRLAEEL